MCCVWYGLLKTFNQKLKTTKNLYIVHNNNNNIYLDSYSYR